MLIKEMSLEEKASLMSGANFWNTKSVERVKIPSMMLTDGPHGLRKQGGKADNLGLNKSIPATCYPTASALANSWDEELLEKLGEHLGLEAASEGVSVLLGPGVNIKRSPLCGRNFEYFSEDPYLAGKCAAALIRGIQSQGVSACVKHYAANSQEHLRMSNDSLVDERTLREIYLPAFEMAVKEGGTNCLMTSYNRVNGTYANENMHLVREILYEDWGYEGMVVTDWGGNNDRVEAIKAGCTLEMPSSNGITDAQIVKAVREGRLSEKLLDEQVDRLLSVLIKTREGIRGKSYDKQAHHEFAVKAAEETAVLLKNKGLLPLDMTKHYAVIGDFAETPRYQGAGSSLINPTRLDNAYDALEKEGLIINGYSKGFERSGKPNGKLLSQAVGLAANVDTVLLFLGLDEASEAEGVDRSHLKLPENQIKLLEEIYKVNKNIVVILSAGSATETDWDIYANALIHGFLGGQGGATAMARLLTGKANPCGKLSESFPYKLSDMPSTPWYPGRELTSEYREGIFVGYRYFATTGRKMRYPFGHGLSYTEFEYSGLEVQEDKISFSIKNVGKTAGAEVAQLYVSPMTEGTFRAKLELKGFRRVRLEPGEEKRVEIPLCDRSFAYWNIDRNGWAIEPGRYELLVGASCEDIRLRGETVKQGEAVPDPYDKAKLAPYYSGSVHNVSAAQFEALLGRKLPPAEWDREKKLEFNDTIAQGFYAKGALGKALCGSLKLYEGTMRLTGNRKAANDVSFIMNLPYRNMGRMSGLFSDEQTMALLKVINREKGGWKALKNAEKHKNK